MIWIPASIVAGLFLLSVVILLAKVDDWSRDLSSNYAQTDPAAKNAALHPLKLADSPDSVRTRLLAWVDAQSNWQLAREEKDADGVVRLELVRSTGLVRYKDDIVARLIPDGAGTRVEAESRSRVGKADFGQNPRNLKELLAAAQ